MASNDLHNRLQQFVDGELNHEEAELLLEKVEADKEAERELSELQETASELKAALGHHDYLSDMGSRVIAALAEEMEAEAPSKPALATVSYIQGGLSHKPSGTDSWLPAMSGKEILAGDSIQTGSAGKAYVIMADGTDLWVNNNTELRFPAVDKRRQVDMPRGELWASVSKQRKPFRLRAPQANINVLGTEFDTCIQDSENMSVTLLRGKVRVENKSGSVQMLSGSQLQVKKDRAPGNAVKHNVKDAVRWAEGLVSSSITEGRATPDRINRLNRDLDPNKKGKGKMKKFLSILTIIVVAIVGIIIYQKMNETPADYSQYTSDLGKDDKSAGIDTSGSYTLRYKYVPGRIQVSNFSMNSTGKTEMNGSNVSPNERISNVQMEMSMDIKEEILEVNDDGSIVVKLNVGEIKLDIKQPKVDVSMVYNDGQGRLTARGPDGTIMQDMDMKDLPINPLAKLSGEVHFTQTTLGKRIISEDSPSKTNSAPVDTNPMSSIGGMDDINSMMENNSLILPEEPLSIGDTWETEIPDSYGMEGISENTFEDLVMIDGDLQAKIKSVFDVEVINKEVPEKNATINSMYLKGAGYSYFSIDKGALVKAESRMSIKQDVDTPLTGNIKIDMDMTILIQYK